MLRILSTCFRIRQQDVCSLSTKERDYHDYWDTVEQEPWHFVPLKCRHCGKEFYL